MKVCIVGASGKLGRYMVRHALDRGYEVVGVCRERSVGKLEAFAAPGSYLILRRTWRTGDKVEVVLPMSLRLERLPDDPKIAAILYGPTVLAGELGTEGLTPDKIVNQYAPTGDPVPVPRFETGNPDPSAWIKPVLIISRWVERSRIPMASRASRR